MITAKHFKDWEDAVFGYGYGSGEQHTVPALRQLLELTDKRGGYVYTTMEEALGPVAAWLLLNVLLHADILEYGVSPRFGWLTGKGTLLREFMLAHGADELVKIVNDEPDDYVHCLPDYCNCTGENCNNPLF
jgi:hypothetical protein